MPFTVAPKPKPTNILRGVQVGISLAVGTVRSYVDVAGRIADQQRSNSAVGELAKIQAENERKRRAGGGDRGVAVGARMPSGKRGYDIIPVLESTDYDFLVVPFQVAPKEIQVQHGAQRYAVGSGYGQVSPFLQWTGADLSSVTFEAEFFYDPPMALEPDSLFKAPSDLYDYVTKLVTHANYDSFLGRTRLWRFRWGNFRFESCVLIIGTETIGSVQPGFTKRSKADLSLVNMRRASAPSDGDVVRTKLQITLQKYRPFDYELSNPQASKHETIYAVAHVNDQWEHLAARIYGDAHYGQSLRMRFPTSVKPTPGQVYALPDLDKIQGERYQPQSLALSWEVDAQNELEALNAHYETPRYVPGYGLRAA